MIKLIPLIILLVIAVNLLREGNFFGFLITAAIFISLLRWLRPVPQKDAPAKKKGGRVQQLVERIGTQMRTEMERQKAAVNGRGAPTAGESGWERFMPTEAGEQEPVETIDTIEEFIRPAQELPRDAAAVAATVPRAPRPRPERPRRTAAVTPPAKPTPAQGTPLDLAQAMIWCEILGPPVSLRDDGKIPGGS